MDRHSIPLVLAILLGFSRVLDATEPQLAHMVFFTLADDTPDHRQQLVAACQKHLSQHNVSFPFRITIVGRDLQLEGITRNQQIRGFSHRDKSLAEVLTALAIQANPVTTVKSPSDPNQKLVWVVAPDKKSILISTRNAALARSDTLPEVFRAR